MSQLMIVSMLVFFGLTVPIAVSIGLGAMAGVSAANLPSLVVAQQLYAALDKYPLVAIPFFILAGNLMEAGGISERMVEFAKSLVGGVQGGLAMACVVTCMIFAAVAGSSVATTFAVGAILIPAMVRHGYPAPFAASLQATAAELGVIIPPSIPMILFAVSTDTSTGELFIAGVVPGILIAGALMAYVWLYARRNGLGLEDGEGRLALWPAFKRAWLALLMPAIILGGIYGGIFTPTEASVVAVVYAVVVGMLIYRRISFSTLSATLHRSVVSTATIMFIIANAGVFGFLLNRAGVPDALGQWLAQVFSDKVSFLLGVNAALFVIGMFIETSASIVVLAPLLLPVAVAFGIDPVHFGIIMVINLALGMITPPFGVNLFAAGSIARVPLERLIRPLLPFVGTVVACLLLITYVPQLSLALRDLVYR
ncbi:MAG: C4-dicarboxylate ABC transporter permease [Betaproteobacteria bacterium HGW-Betaproteobacteria-13]|jgi:tripartite ATP-independent transporter DctM subunit|uniref:TRAP transporter large permease protein n=1 Tax=Parazoarcus communis TaxID=41977 RepID=A0A2U8GX75_9RHOO|nr:TRAP transporter large permease subunit [Parazoarcus communis]AWI77883.1 C4-dicarboxylate ABC transporter permease [Parazoarcus communis]MCK9259359.1 TRAP transporter large permease subunit [Azoarcus sp.]MDD2872200.1 TRAP transporter large permease subunit [Azoarcus sp.]PKO80851.1 MAG: C4-dicarboxylate ABC transporter permease [Betaproteobacteria bacterium HGW-Betaproteobacteria-13]